MRSLCQYAPAGQPPQGGDRAGDEEPLAANGAQGVCHVLELLRAELELAMTLAGRPTLDSIDRSLVKMT